MEKLRMSPSSTRQQAGHEAPRPGGEVAISLVLVACVLAVSFDIPGCGSGAGTGAPGGSAAGGSAGGSIGEGEGGGAMPPSAGGAGGRAPSGAGGGSDGAAGSKAGSTGSMGLGGRAGTGGRSAIAGASGSNDAGVDRSNPGVGGANGVGGSSGPVGGGGNAGAVDGWYEAEAVPPNVLTYAATVSHTDEGQNRTCPVDTQPGLSALQAHGVTEGANCASAGGMVVNILGRSPCNPETPSSYTNCQNLGAGVEFHDVTVPADGTYDVTWWYHCGLDDHYGDTTCGGVHYPVGSSCRPHLIDVNGVPMSPAGAKYYQFPCYPTAWSYIHAATTALPLKAGSNVVYIHAPGATTLDAVDVDAINVLPQGKGAPPVATPVMRGN